MHRLLRQRRLRHDNLRGPDEDPAVVLQRERIADLRLAVERHEDDAVAAAKIGVRRTRRTRPAQAQSAGAIGRDQQPAVVVLRQSRPRRRDDTLRIVDQIQRAADTERRVTRTVGVVADDARQIRERRAADLARDENPLVGLRKDLRVRSVPFVGQIAPAADTERRVDTAVRGEAPPVPAIAGAIQRKQLAAGLHPQALRRFGDDVAAVPGCAAVAVER